MKVLGVLHGVSLGVERPDATLMAVMQRDLRRDEGVRRSAYQDSRGYWTIGCGRLIDGRLQGGLADDEIDYLLANDIAHAYRAATKYIWYANLDVVRQRAVLNLLFNLGATKFAKFKRMIAALASGDYMAAADHLTDSAWFRQVGGRGPRITAMVRTGTDVS